MDMFKVYIRQPGCSLTKGRKPVFEKTLANSEMTNKLRLILKT